MHSPSSLCLSSTTSFLTSHHRLNKHLRRPYHIKRTGAYSAEASVLTESNPYVYKAIPGKEREVFLPLMVLTLKGLAKVMEQQHTLTSEEQREFQTVLGKANTLLEGASVGLPKDKSKN